MADTISLLFKLVSDSSQARGDLSGFQSLISGNLNSLRTLYKRFSDDAKSAGDVTAQSFKVLEGSLLNFLGDSREAKSLITEFNNAIKIAAGGNQELTKTFQSLGVNINQALKNPEAGLAQFLAGFGKIGTEAEKAVIAETVFLSTSEGLVPALAAASTGMQALAVSETEAAGAATFLDAALAPAIVAIAAIVAITTAGAAGMFALAKGAAESDTKIKDLSEKTGVSVRNISLLTAAARENGLNFDIVARSLDQFVTRLDDAARSSGKTEGALAFKKLGVEGKESLKDINASLETVINSLNKTENASVRYADTQRAFGLRNDQAALILKTLGGSLDDYSKRLDTVGVVTEAQAAASKSFETSLNRLSAATSGVALNIGRELIPLFQPMIDLTKTIVQLIGDVLISVIRACAPQVTNLATGIDLLNAALRASPQFINVLRAALADAVTLFIRTSSVVGDTAKALAAFATGNFALAAESAGKVATGVNTLFDGIGDRTKKALEAAKRATAENLLEIQANRKKFDAAARGGNVDLPDKGSKDSEAEARAELKILEIAEKQKELLFQEESDAIKLQLSQRLISHETYTKQLIRVEEVRLKARLDFIASESKQVEASNLKERDKNLKLAELELKADQERANTKKAVNDLNEQQRLREEQAERDHQQKLLDLQLAADRQQIERIKELEKQRVLGPAEAERQIAEIEQQSFARRKEALEKQRDLVGPDSNYFQKLVDQVNALEQERAAAFEKSGARILAARQKELEEHRAFARTLNKIEQDIIADEIALEKDRIDRLSARVVTTGDRQNVIDLRAANDRRAEALRHDQAIEAIQRQEEEQAKQASDLNEFLQIITVTDQRIEEEQRRHNHALTDIAQDQSTATAVNDPNSNVSIFGVQDEDISRFDAIKQAGIIALGELAAAGGSFRDVMKSAFAGVAQAAQSVLSAFILTGKAGGQAFKQLAAEIIASVAIQSAIKAIFETAEGFAALAAFDPATASLHFAAAKIYAIVAAGAAAVGIGIGVAGGLGGGNDNSSQSQGAGAFGGQQQSKESKFTSGDVTGKLGQDADSQTHGVLQPIFDKISSVYDLHRQVVEEHKQALDRQTAVQERHAQAAEALVTRISSISPEDSLAIAVDRAPEHIGRGLDAATTNDAGVTRNLALKLGVA